MPNWLPSRSRDSTLSSSPCLSCLMYYKSWVNIVYKYLTESNIQILWTLIDRVRVSPSSLLIKTRKLSTSIFLHDSPLNMLFHGDITVQMITVDKSLTQPCVCGWRIFSRLLTFKVEVSSNIHGSHDLCKRTALKSECACVFEYINKCWGKSQCFLHSLHVFSSSAHSSLNCRISTNMCQLMSLCVSVVMVTASG